MDTLAYERRTRRKIEGTVLSGTYRIERRIGHGGMGDVYIASHARLPGRFAVKVLLPELIGNQEAFARFCREAEIMSQLRHPNIVQIFDFDTAPDGRPFFVMEYLEGRDLEIAPGRSGARCRCRCVVRIVGAIGSALAAAHGHGVIHRDLKPANMFLAVRRRADRRDREGARLRDLEGADRRRGSRGARICSARPPTWRPSRPAVTTTPSTAAPISSRWARSRSAC